MVEISTSLLSVEKDKIVKTIYNLEVAKTDYFHIDVMDGKFVESFTNEIMEEYCGYIKSISTVPLDVHLMVENVREYIDKYLNYEPNSITFHVEAIKDKQETLELIKYVKENGCKVGIAINPDTDISEIFEYLNQVHLAIVMTVVPGKGGQDLIESTVEKIKVLKKYVDENNLDVDIEADGGINVQNAQSIKEAGSNIIVSGSGIIKSEDFKKTIELLKS